MYSRAEEYREKNVLLTICLKNISYVMLKAYCFERPEEKITDKESVVPWRICEVEKDA